MSTEECSWMGQGLDVGSICTWQLGPLLYHWLAEWTLGVSANVEKTRNDTSAAFSMCQQWPEQIRRLCENVSKRITSTETRLFTDREKGRGYGGGGRGRLYTYCFTVTTKMSPVLWWAAMRAVLMFHNCEGQSQDSVHNFWRERWAKANSIWGLPAYQPNAYQLQLGQTGSLIENGRKGTFNCPHLSKLMQGQPSKLVSDQNVLLLL